MSVHRSGNKKKKWPILVFPIIPNNLFLLGCLYCLSHLLEMRHSLILFIYQLSLFLNRREQLWKISLSCFAYCWNVLAFPFRSFCAPWLHYLNDLYGKFNLDFILPRWFIVYFSNKTYILKNGKSIKAGLELCYSILQRKK